MNRLRASFKLCRKILPCWAGSPGKFDQVSDAEQLAKPTTPKFMDEWDDEEEVDDSTTYVWGIK